MAQQRLWRAIGGAAARTEAATPLARCVPTHLASAASYVLLTAGMAQVPIWWGAWHARTRIPTFAPQPHNARGLQRNRQHAQGGMLRAASIASISRTRTRGGRLAPAYT